jgi:hypothetical protein
MFCLKKIRVFIALLALCPITNAQDVNWQVLSPLPNTSIAISELFISVSVDERYTISPVEPAYVFLDDKKVSGNLKISGNKLHMLYPGKLYSGKHKLLVDVYIEQLKKREHIEWEFSLRTQFEDAVPATNPNNTAVSLSGSLVLDSRQESISGPGQALRQEPNETRTVTLDAAVKYKDAVMPIRLFATTNNQYALQSMNYMQIGFINKWLEVEAGDLNPNTDPLVLSGIRVRGVKTMFKYRANSLQLYYGQMNKPSEGSIESYLPGSGIVPANLVNDSQYINPGTYKRMMIAARLEMGDRREIFKIGMTAFKAKDDTGSIRYGVLPKDNIAGGIDAMLKLFRKKVTIHTGIAASVLTNDISNGVIDKEALDTTFNIKIDFEPKNYEKLIILNASTVPTVLTTPDFISHFSRLNFKNKYQQFSFEYRKNGALYNSLGSPFLRNNYEGFSVGEKFWLLKKKLTFGLNYQNYSNNLNNSLPSKVYTNAYRANLFIYIKSAWPTLYLNYMYQDRSGRSHNPAILGVDDILNNYMVNLGYGRNFWNIDHHLSLMLNASERRDRLRPDNQFNSYNAMVSLNESFGKKYGIQASYGKMIITGNADMRISNVTTYNLGFDWQIKPQKYFTSISLSNTNTLPTALATQSYRLSTILRFGYKFYRGMELNAEGGYQPFRDQNVSANNYNEAYFYIRYISDLGMLFTK